MVATIGEGNDNSNYKYVEPSIEMPSSSFNLVACYEKTDKQIEEGYTPVRVNEISAANDIYVNEYGKKPTGWNYTTLPTRISTWRECI